MHSPSSHIHPPHIPHFLLHPPSSHTMYLTSSLLTYLTSSCTLPPHIPHFLTHPPSSHTSFPYAPSLLTYNVPHFLTSTLLTYLTSSCTLPPHIPHFLTHLPPHIPHFLTHPPSSRTSLPYAPSLPTWPSVFGGLDSGLDSGLDCGTGLTESCAHHFEASKHYYILT